MHTANHTQKLFFTSNTNFECFFTYEAEQGHDDRARTHCESSLRKLCLSITWGLSEGPQGDTTFWVYKWDSLYDDIEVTKRMKSMQKFVSSVLLVTDLSSFPFRRLNDSALMNYLGLEHSSKSIMQKNTNEKSKECDSFLEITVFLNEMVLFH